ncbi:Glutamine-dependent NAD(+) synthetase [Strongyloides ratti]|uniref:Glutamine-dependent NAD(+) synthetase n=1 Tax=Strongyloides ratti TaxID=34506 RepID=A0A090LPQ9_STRRB|nr:Glutamine-dependent NAD(+) synthetase [Strongyloides ratti]CEF69535.1 Glutamine-dependent NAD(+) synthetase [Strongyloides ratti]
MLTKHIHVSVCTLNNWALDFDGNVKRIIQSCKEAHERGAKIRVGPELEITGYSCLDHFNEADTEAFAWDSLKRIVEASFNMRSLLIITSMPIRYKLSLYNCAIAVNNGKIIFIRPKQSLCDDGVYREGRYFNSWKKPGEYITFEIPTEYCFTQTSVPFGDGILKSEDGVTVGFEICEELWTCQSPHKILTLENVDIICNPSASHHVLSKSSHRLNQLLLGTTSKLGGIYLYSNFRGCDGERVFFDGMSSIAQNGKLFCQIDQFLIEDVEVADAVIDLEDSRNYRQGISSNRNDSSFHIKNSYIHLPVKLLDGSEKELSEPIEPKILSEMEELSFGPPTYLWHYLRRSKQAGYFVPLSGGMDSATVATMVRLMCEHVVDCRKKYIEKYGPNKSDPAHFYLGEIINCTGRELCGKILFTCYMGSENSSTFTKECALSLAKDLGSKHSSILIDTIVSACLNVFNTVYNFIPSFKNSDNRETMALQNIQARVRMVLAYLFAQLSLVGEKRPGNLLVLGSANVDESLIGYLTKYDCSSADFNPIGSLCKSHLRLLLNFVISKYHFNSLQKIVNSPPSAELKPLSEGEICQTDEEEIGLTYDELSTIGKLRQPRNMGPYSMFLKLSQLWGNKMTQEEVADKVKLFYRRYAINRHKSTVLTPSYHVTTYSNDDHRNDHRPFLYPDFKVQFDKIDAILKEKTEGKV